MRKRSPSVASGRTLRRGLAPRDALAVRSEPLPWTGCVVWLGSLNEWGYGVIQVGAKKKLAHRYAWEVEVGEIPEGEVIDHVCHEPSCINIDHLRTATPAENARNRRGAHRGRALPRGVYQRNPGGGYQAVVRDCYLGTYPTEQDAAAVASAGRRGDFGEFAGRD